MKKRHFNDYAGSIDYRSDNFFRSIDRASGYISTSIFSQKRKDEKGEHTIGEKTGPVPGFFRKIRDKFFSSPSHTNIMDSGHLLAERLKSDYAGLFEDYVSFLEDASAEEKRLYGDKFVFFRDMKKRRLESRTEELGNNVEEFFNAARERLMIFENKVNLVYENRGLFKLLKPNDSQRLLKIGELARYSKNWTDLFLRDRMDPGSSAYAIGKISDFYLDKYFNPLGDRKNHADSEPDDKLK